MRHPESVPELVTLHVWRIAPTAVGRFGKLLGTGTATGFGPGDADLTRWAALTVWDSPAAAARFADSPVARAWSGLAARASGSTCGH